MSGHIFFASHSSPDHHEARPRAFARGFLPATVFALLALASNGLAGCAKSEVVSAGGANGGATGGGAVAQGTSGAGGTIQLTINTTPTVTPSSVDAEVTSQMVGCDGGDGCTCPPLNVAVLGKPGKWGANPNGDPDTALQDWLSSSSAGTARVDNFIDRVTLTSDFLATYNVIILASLSDDSNTGPWWTYSADEIAASRRGSRTVAASSRLPATRAATKWLRITSSSAFPASPTTTTACGVHAPIGRSATAPNQTHCRIGSARIPW